MQQTLYNIHAGVHIFHLQTPPRAVAAILSSVFNWLDKKRTQTARLDDYKVDGSGLVKGGTENCIISDLSILLHDLKCIDFLCIMNWMQRSVTASNKRMEVTFNRFAISSEVSELKSIHKMKLFGLLIQFKNLIHHPQKVTMLLLVMNQDLWIIIFF